MLLISFLDQTEKRREKQSLLLNMEEMVQKDKRGSKSKKVDKEQEGRSYQKRQQICSLSWSLSNVDFYQKGKSLAWMLLAA